MRYKFSEEEIKNFKQICENSKTMSEAAEKLNLHFNTFKRYAIKFGCFKPNQGGKGLKKPHNESKIKTLEILNGKYPNYQTYKLKIRLIREGFIEDKCSICGWNGTLEGNEFSNCELHHIDGNRWNHRFENLQLLCPNCHSMTKSYRARNKS